MKSFNICYIILFIGTNLIAQKWTEMASLPDSANGRHHPITFAIDNYGYMGLGNAQDSLLSDFYRYDPTTDTWTELNHHPGGARGYSLGLTYNGKGYLGFGLNSANEALADLWEYNPLIDTWTKKATCPCMARIHPALLALDGKIYVGLGGSSNGNLNDWWEYDILSERWTQRASFPGVVRHHPYQFSISPYAYVGMGHGALIYNDLYRYDPSNDTWKEMKSLPDQGRVAGTQFDYKGKGYVLSGQGVTHDYMETGEFWEYDPSIDDWTQLEPHPNGESRWAPASFVLDGKVYFTGGEIRDIHYKDLYRYEFKAPNYVANNNDKKAIHIYPNPVSDFINLEHLHYPESFQSIGVKDLLGKELLFIQPTNGETSQSINISHLNAGLYFLNIQDKEGKTKSYPIIKN